MGGEKISRKENILRKRSVFKTMRNVNDVLAAYKLEKSEAYEEAFNKHLSNAATGENKGDYILSAISYFRAGDCAKRMGNIAKAKKLYLKAAKSLMKAVEKNKPMKDRSIRIYRRAALYAMYAEKYKLAEDLLRKSRELEEEM